MFNPFTSKSDYITKIDTNTIIPGTNITATSSNGTVTINATGGGSSSLPLPGGATNYIWNSDTLQTGATAYPETILSKRGTFSTSFILGGASGAGDADLDIYGVGLFGGKALTTYGHCIFGTCFDGWKTGINDPTGSTNYTIYSVTTSTSVLEVDANAGGRVSVLSTSGLYVKNDLQINTFLHVTSTATVTSADEEFSLSSIGPVLTDSAGCRWRTGVSTLGALTTTSLGCPVLTASRKCLKGQSLGILLSITCRGNEL